MTHVRLGNNGKHWIEQAIEQDEGGSIPDPLELGAAVFATSLAVGVGTWAVDGSDTSIDLTSRELGTARLFVSGDGAQIIIEGADGTGDNPGGEVQILSGSSEGNEGGQILIAAGPDSGGADGGSIVISSGFATNDGNGGSGGNIDIKAGGGEFSDWRGGDVTINGGHATDNRGGHVHIQGGTSTNGARGHVALYEGGGSYGLEIQPTALVFTQASPPMVPAIATAQDIVDALVTLGLIGQSA